METKTERKIAEKRIDIRGQIALEMETKREIHVAVRYAGCVNEDIHCVQQVSTRATKHKTAHTHTHISKALGTKL